MKNVANSSTVLEVFKNIKGFILERNPTSVKNVAKTSEHTQHVLDIGPFISERNVTSVKNVAKPFTSLLV